MEQKRILDTVQKINRSDIVSLSCHTMLIQNFQGFIYCLMFRHSRAMQLVFYRNGMTLPFDHLNGLGHAQINTTRNFSQQTIPKPKLDVCTAHL